jgi:hypothetical protein
MRGSSKQRLLVVLITTAGASGPQNEAGEALLAAPKQCQFCSKMRPAAAGLLAQHDVTGGALSARPSATAIDGMGVTPSQTRLLAAGHP